MKPIFRLLMLFIFAVPNFITAQENNTACNLNYKIGVTPDAEISTNDIIAVMKWDFSDAIKSAKSITVELVPIEDCFRKEDAKEFKKSILYTITKENAKDFKKIKLLEINSKCFKWRVTVVTATCEKATNYSYYNFVQ